MCPQANMVAQGDGKFGREDDLGNPSKPKKERKDQSPSAMRLILLEQEKRISSQKYLC